MKKIEALFTDGSTGPANETLPIKKAGSEGR